jgi:hypothetical protein
MEKRGQEKTDVPAEKYAIYMLPQIYGCLLNENTI